MSKGAFAVDVTRRDKIIVGIDPGTVSGLAFLDFEGRVIGVAAFKPPDHSLAFEHLTHMQPNYLAIVVEIPVVYPRHPERARSLLRTAYRAGWIEARVSLSAWVGSETHPVTPAAWKGQVPKSIHNERTWKLLSKKEQFLFEQAEFNKGELDDVLDAVGIAKWGFNKWPWKRVKR